MSAVWLTVTRRGSAPVIGILMSPDTALGTQGNLAARCFRDHQPVPDGLRQPHFVFRTPPRRSADLTQAYHELIAEGAQIVVGGMLSDTGLVLASVATETKVPVIGVTASTAALSQQQDYFFRVMMDTDGMGRAAAAYVKNQGYKRIVAIYGRTNASYTQDVVKAMRRHTGETVRISGDQFLQADESESLQALWSLQPDVLYLAMSPSDFLQAVILIRKDQPDLPIIGTEWSSGVVDGARHAALEGVRFISRCGTRPEPFARLAARFNQIYDQKAGLAADFTFSALAWSYSALAKAQQQGVKVHDVLKASKHVTTAYGPVHIDQWGDAHQLTCSVREFRNGALHIVESITVPEAVQAP